MKKYQNPTSVVLEFHSESPILSASGSDRFYLNDSEAASDALTNRKEGIFPGLWEEYEDEL